MKRRRGGERKARGRKEGACNGENGVGRGGMSPRPAICRRAMMHFRARESLRLSGGRGKGGEGTWEEGRETAHLSRILAALAKALFADNEPQVEHYRERMQAAVKKAKVFLLRKAVRKLKEAKEAGNAGVTDAAEIRLILLKALPPGLIAQEALAGRGVIVPAGKCSKSQSGTDEEEWRHLSHQHEHIAASLVNSLLANAGVGQALDSACTVAAAGSNANPEETMDGCVPRTGAMPGARESRKRARAADGAAVEEQDSKASKSTVSRAKEKQSDMQKGSTPRKAPERKPAQGATSIFMSTLADGTDDDDDDRSSDDGSEAGGGVFSMGSGGKMPGVAKKKLKNVISRSGNRMGQRQRRALLEQQASGGTDTSKGRGQGGGKAGGRAMAARTGRGGRSGARGGSAHSGSASGGGGNAGKAKKPASSPSAAPLHPSWEAKKAASASIQPFQGKKVTFD